jgi:predicted RNA-binding protein YlxR (DUF448 family)
MAILISKLGDTVTLIFCRAMDGMVLLLRMVVHEEEEIFFFP